MEEAFILIFWGIICLETIFVSFGKDFISIVFSVPLYSELMVLTRVFHPVKVKNIFSLLVGLGSFEYF